MEAGVEMAKKLARVVGIAGRIELGWFRNWVELEWWWG